MDIDEMTTYDEICKILNDNIYHTNYKLKVFIINLDTEEERLKTSITQFSTIFFNVNRFNAIKGNDIINLNSVQSIIDMDVSKYTNGQVGCLMSHLSLIKMFLMMQLLWELLEKL